MFGMGFKAVSLGALTTTHNVIGGKRKFEYKKLADEGYRSNALVYRCVNEITKGAASVPWDVKSGDDILEDHPLIHLLNRPNPQQSYSEFVQSLFSYLVLSGNAFILPSVGSITGKPKELHLLRPDRIKIKADGESPYPQRYEYEVDGKTVGVYEVDQGTGQSELKHLKLWDPLDDHMGCSPMSAAAMEVDQHNALNRHNIALLENGARPSGALVFRPMKANGTPGQLTKEQRQQLFSDIRSKFTGSFNSGRPMVLDGDFDWKEMGISPKDMDFLNLKHTSATGIAMCFGVPAQLVGVPDAQTYSNMAEARLALYEETIIPHLKQVESDLNEWLVPMFGGGLSFKFRPEDIPALSERRKRIYENVVAAVNAGIMTRNEAREMVGLTPLDGADELMVPSSLLPLAGEEGTDDGETDEYPPDTEFPG